MAVDELEQTCHCSTSVGAVVGDNVRQPWEECCTQHVNEVGKERQSNAIANPCAAQNIKNCKKKTFHGASCCVNPVSSHSIKAFQIPV